MKRITKQLTRANKKSNEIIVHSNFLRKDIYDIEEIFDILNLINRRCNKTFIINYDTINYTKLLYRFYKKGIVCNICGIKGQFFAKEREHLSPKYSLRLYGIDKSGNEILMTADHIVPFSISKNNTLTNIQILCYNCNQNKDNKI